MFNVTLCFITNRRLYGDDESVAQERLLEAIGAAARAGVDLIQIRERDLDDRALLSLVRRAMVCVSETGARVFVNDRADLAIVAGAHGVHLRGDSVPASRVRDLASALIVGRSVHAVHEAVAAERQGGCEYLLAGTLFPTSSKAHGHALLGIDGLRRLCEAVRVPMVAVGGITVERAGDAARAGAAGVAGIRIFSDPSTTADVVARLRRSFDT